ncbi:MAG: DUF1573 domain-containing protein [Holophagaceae bacterium]|nr:DUF1573 domain-containing protein [Holophagaceae bacterium]
MFFSLFKRFLLCGCLLSASSCIVFCAPQIPGLSISETDIDFGTIASTQPVSRVITIKNQSQQAFDIQYARASCGCLAIELHERNIPPSAAINITARLDPSGYVGGVGQVGELGFQSGSGEKGTISFRTKAFIQNPIRLTPPSIAFRDIDMNAEKDQAYYRSGPILVAPADNVIRLNPIASIPEKYDRAFIADIGKRDDGFILDAYFFPRQILEATDDRTGNFNVKIYMDETKSQFVNLPVSWRIKSNFSISPEKLLFVDNVAQDYDVLTVKTLDARPFQIIKIQLNGKTLDEDKINSPMQNIFEIKLNDIGEMIDQASNVARSELIIATSHVEEPIIKIPITTLLTSKGK